LVVAKAFAKSISARPAAIVALTSSAISCFWRSSSSLLHERASICATAWLPAKR
jgi:hypothetical protein